MTQSGRMSDEAEIAGRLTKRDMDTLAELAAFHDNMRRLGRPERGAKPIDVGGGSRSHHSATLTKLSKRGLVDRQNWARAGERGSCAYRITDLGRHLLEHPNAD